MTRVRWGLAIVVIAAPYLIWLLAVWIFCAR